MRNFSFTGTYYPDHNPRWNVPYTPKERCWDCVTNKMYDREVYLSLPHIPIFEALRKECVNRNRVDCPESAPYIKEWLEEAYQIAHQATRIIALKLDMSPPTLEQIKEAVGSNVLESNYETCKVWAVNVSKLLNVKV